jgi:GNAT superfamily N-acetyltransferase
MWAAEARATLAPSPHPHPEEPTVTVTSSSRGIGAYESRVRMSAPADLAAMGYILAAAFHDDPVMSWAIPDDARRRATLPRAMEMLAEYFQPLGANRVNESGTGAAVWCPPGASPGPDADAQLDAGLQDRCPDDLARTGEIMDLLAWHHPSEPHHYLNFLGVIPDRQGAGIGSALLRSVLDDADLRGEAAYLEATSPGNRAFCERHGFVVVDELRTGDCPPLWAMWRQPHRS